MCENRGYLSTTTAVHHTHSEGSSGRLRFREQLTYLVLPFIIMSVSCCKAVKMSFLHYQAPSSERSELPLYTVCVPQPNFTYLTVLSCEKLRCMYTMNKNKMYAARFARVNASYTFKAGLSWLFGRKSWYESMHNKSPQKVCLSRKTTIL